MPISDLFAGGPTPEQQLDLAGQWRNWINEPGNRAALLQTGLALMQPQGIGQTGPGQVAGAIGQGAEAGQRYAETERKIETEDTKNELARARGQSALENAAARSSIAETRAQSAADRVGMQRERLAFDRERHAARLPALQAQAELAAARVREIEARVAAAPDNMLLKQELNSAKVNLMQAQTDLATARSSVVQQDADTRRMGAETGAQRASDTSAGLKTSQLVRLQGEYRKYTSDVQKRNSDPLRNPKEPPEKIMGFDQWVGQNPRLLQAIGGAPAAPAIPDVSTTQAPPGPAVQPPAAPAAQQYSEGQTATGPGGKKIIFKQGKWVPM